MGFKRGLLVAFFIAAVTAGMAADPAFDVSIPEGWEKRGPTDQFLYQKDTELLSVTAEDLPTECGSPDEYVARVKGEMRRTVANCLFKPVTAGNRDGLETRSVSYSVAYAGIEFRYDVLYVFADDRVYTVQVRNSGRKLVQDRTPDVVAIFESFRIK